MTPRLANPSAVVSSRAERTENSANHTSRELARQVRSASPMAPYSRFLASSFNHLESCGPWPAVKLHAMEPVATSARLHRRISLRTSGTVDAATMPRISSARVGAVFARAPSCRILSTPCESVSEPQRQGVGRSPDSNCASARFQPPVY
jgi:hypothetical protein